MEREQSITTDTNKLLNEVLLFKKLNKISWDTLAKNLPITGGALSVAFKRKSVNINYLNEIAKQFNINLNPKKRAVKKPAPISSFFEGEELSQKDILKFLHILIYHKKAYENYEVYKLFEQNIRQDEKNKTLLAYLKLKLKNLEEEDNKQ